MVDTFKGTVVFEAEDWEQNTDYSYMENARQPMVIHEKNVYIATDYLNNGTPPDQDPAWRCIGSVEKGSGALDDIEIECDDDSIEIVSKKVKDGVVTYTLRAIGMKGDKGEPGEAGPQGEPGTDGVDGKNGKSAFELWLEAGNEGDIEDFLSSLVGPNGVDGADGKDGKDGQQGEQGPEGERGVDGQSITYNNQIVKSLVLGSNLKKSIDEDGNLSIDAKTGGSGGNSDYTFIYNIQSNQTVKSGLFELEDATIKSNSEISISGAYINGLEPDSTYRIRARLGVNASSDPYKGNFNFMISGKSSSGTNYAMIANNLPDIQNLVIENNTLMATANDGAATSLTIQKSVVVSATPSISYKPFCLNISAASASLSNLPTKYSNVKNGLSADQLKMGYAILAGGYHPLKNDGMSNPIDIIAVTKDGSAKAYSPILVSVIGNDPLTRQDKATTATGGWTKSDLGGTITSTNQAVMWSQSRAIQISDDEGMNWILQQGPLDMNVYPQTRHHCACGVDKAIWISSNSTNAAVYNGTDLVKSTLIEIANSVIWDQTDNQFLAFSGVTGSIQSSSTGVNWKLVSGLNVPTAASVGDGYTLTGVTYSPELDVYIAVYNKSYFDKPIIKRSTNCKQWTTMTLPEEINKSSYDAPIWGKTCGNSSATKGVFVFCPISSGSATPMYSYNGIDLGMSNKVETAAKCNNGWKMTHNPITGVFYMAIQQNDVHDCYSVDAVNWIRAPYDIKIYGYGVFNAGCNFVLSGGGGGFTYIVPAGYMYWFLFANPLKPLTGIPEFLFPNNISLAVSASEVKSKYHWQTSDKYLYSFDPGEWSMSLIGNTLLPNADSPQYLAINVSGINAGDVVSSISSYVVSMVDSFLFNAINEQDCTIYGPAVYPVRLGPDHIEYNAFVDTATKPIVAFNINYSDNTVTFLDDSIIEIEKIS